MKRTLIVAGGTAASALRLETARAGTYGWEIRSIEQVAARLAGGFLCPVESDTLSAAAADALREAIPDDLGDLLGIADLPGLPGALAATLSKAWHTGIDLDDRAARQPGVARLATLARLEAAVLERLPRGMLRPADLVRRALDRLAHAPAVLGAVECRSLPDLAPCWRPLLAALAGQIDVTWHAGSRPVPAWVREAGLRVLTVAATNPDVSIVTCATVRHEAIEAMRWARGLLATGTVRAQDIAFAAAAPGAFDDLILVMSQEANLDVHFAHGRRALTMRDGQAAAALADVLLHGLSQERVRRLSRLAHEPGTPFGRLPENWARGLPRTAPLPSPERWRQALANGTLDTEATGVLLSAIDLLAQGSEKAAEAGEAFLRGRTRLIWRRALARAPATALEASLAGLCQRRSKNASVRRSKIPSQLMATRRLIGASC